MSIASHPSKRRRLDDGLSALSKPFKSPLKPATRPGEASERAVEKSTDQNLQSNEKVITNSSRPTQPPHPTASTRNTSLTAFPPDKNLKKDPQYIALQKHHTALLLQLTKLRQSLDTAQQALKISSSSTDAELETLISKWKLASREAAEEVFRGAKDRVNRMGGVGAWRERCRKKTKPRGWDDEDDEKRRVQEVELTEAQREQVEVQREELAAERRRYGSSKSEVREEVVGGERDDDSFTMDMMLQSLNIDLDVIGYDKENQRWY